MTSDEWTCGRSVQCQRELSGQSLQKGCRPDPNYAECGAVRRAEEGVLQAHRRRYEYAVEGAAAGCRYQPGGSLERKLVVRWRDCAIRDLTGLGVEDARKRSYDPRMTRRRARSASR